MGSSKTKLSENPKKKKTRGGICSNFRCQKDRPGRTASCQWRKGWKDEDGNSVILCNACGVRFSRGHWCPYCYFIYKSDDGDVPGNPWLYCGGCRRRVHQKCHLSDPSRSLPAEGEPFFCPFCVENGVTKATRSSTKRSTRSSSSRGQNKLKANSSNSKTKGSRGSRSKNGPKDPDPEFTPSDHRRSTRSKRKRSNSNSSSTRSNSSAVPNSSPFMGFTDTSPVSMPPKKQKASPKPNSYSDTEEEWSNAQCLCKSGLGGLMLDCDGCGKYYHPDCVGLNKNKLPSTWFCPFCRISSTPAESFPPGTPLDRSPPTVSNPTMQYHNNRMYNSFNYPHPSKMNNPLITSNPHPGWNPMNQYPNLAPSGIPIGHPAGNMSHVTYGNNLGVGLMISKDSPVWRNPLGHLSSTNTMSVSQSIVDSTKTKIKPKSPQNINNDLNITLAPGDSIEASNEIEKNNPLKVPKEPQSKDPSDLSSSSSTNDKPKDPNSVSSPPELSSNPSKRFKPSSSDSRQTDIPFSPTTNAFRKLLDVPVSSFSNPTIGPQYPYTTPYPQNTHVSSEKPFPNLNQYFTQNELNTLESLLGCPLIHLFRGDILETMTSHQVMKRLSLLISIKKRNTQSELVSINHIECLLSSISGRGPNPPPPSFVEAEKAATLAGEQVTASREKLETSLSQERTKISDFLNSFEEFGPIPQPILRQLWIHVMSTCFPHFSINFLEQQAKPQIHDKMATISGGVPGNTYMNMPVMNRFSQAQPPPFTGQFPGTKLFNLSTASADNQVAKTLINHIPQTISKRSTNMPGELVN